MAFVKDNLLRRESGISHHGELSDDEKLSPFLDNLIVLSWLRLVNNEPPMLVKQRYWTELRSRTLASIEPEISQALGLLLEEILVTGDAKALKTSVLRFTKGKPSVVPSAVRIGSVVPYAERLSDLTVIS